MLASLQLSWQVIRYALIFFSALFRQRASLGCGCFRHELLVIRLTPYYRLQYRRGIFEEVALRGVEGVVSGSGVSAAV